MGRLLLRLQLSSRTAARQINRVGPACVDLRLGHVYVVHSTIVVAKIETTYVRLTAELTRVRFCAVVTVHVRS